MIGTQPILTKRTLGALTKGMSPQDVSALESILQDILEDVIGKYLVGMEGYPDIEFNAHSALYHHRRLKLVVLLLKSIQPNMLPNLFGSVADLSSEIITSNAWRLSPEDNKALTVGFGNYKELSSELLRMSMTPIPTEVKLPRDFLFRSTKMDFALTGAIACLEGDIKGEIQNERLSYLCHAARETTAYMLEEIRNIYIARSPSEIQDERRSRLETLFGVWSDYADLDEDLRLIYESRGNIFEEEDPDVPA